jgi:hypothetical protein
MINHNFILQEGEQITRYHKKEEPTIIEVLSVIIVSPILIYILSSVLFTIIKLIVGQGLIEDYEFNVIIILNIITYLILFILFVIEINTEPSVEIYYFNDYLLITNVPNFYHPSLNFREVKINFEFIDHFILINGRMKIKLNYSQINESKFKEINIQSDWINLLDLMKYNDYTMIINPKLKLKKRELIGFLNRKLKTE